MIDWIAVTEQMPEPGKPRCVLCVSKQGNTMWWARAVWIPAHFADCDKMDYEGDDYEWDEDGNKSYWPEGWYEWNEEEDVHWRMLATVTHWTEIELPEHGASA